jgi:hypothetical protein
MSRYPDKQCPVTPGRLHELYLVEMRSVQDIRTYAREQFGVSVAPLTVQRWLRAAGITLRTPAAAVRLWQKQKPERMLAGTKAMIEQRRVTGGTPAQNRGNAETLKARRNRRKLVAALRPIWKSKHVTLTCKQCGKSFERLGCRARRAERNGDDGPFCSRSCSNRYRFRQQFPARVSEQLESGQYSTTTLAAFKGCHPITVAQAIRDGELRATRNERGHYRIALDDAADWSPRRTRDRSEK